MRHRKGFNHLGRTSAHRKAMLANMAASLILHKRVTTTTAKAKELRSYVEPLITRSKEDTTHSRRVVFRYLKNKFAVTELFREVSPKIAERPGGYTRILKTGNRLGDNADMCIIELVDYNENYLEETDKKAKSTRRRRGGAKKSTTAAEAKAVKGEVAAKEISDSPAETEEVTAEETPSVEAESGSEEVPVDEAPAQQESGESTSATEEEAEEEETKKEE